MFKKVFSLFRKDNINQAKEADSNIAFEDTNVSLVTNVQSHDNKTIIGCPECGGNVIEVINKSNSAWACINSTTGDCKFVLKNTNDNGEKLDISILHEYIASRKSIEERQKELRRFSELEAVIESLKIRKEMSSSNDTSTTDAISTISNNSNKSIATSDTSENNSNEKVGTVIKDTAIEDTTREQITEPSVGVTNTQGVAQEKQESTTPTANESNTVSNKDTNNGVRIYRKCSCGSDIYRFDKTLKCSNKDCNFEISNTYHGFEFSDYQMSQFIGRRISKSLPFVSNSTGKKFYARVFITFDENLNLIPKYKLVFNDEFYKIPAYQRENLFAPDEKDRKEIPLKEFIAKLVEERKSKKENSNKDSNSNYEKNQDKKADFDFNDYKNITNKNKNANQNINKPKGNYVDVEEFNANAKPF